MSGRSSHARRTLEHLHQLATKIVSDVQIGLDELDLREVPDGRRQ